MNTMVARPSGQQSEKDKSHRGNASQFFVAGELCRRGYAAVVTLGNTPNTDVLCSNRAGTRFAHIQVKTFVPGSSKTCSVGVKSERQFGEAFFWILAGIPAPTSDHPFEYFIIPTKTMASKVSSYHRKWLEQPGMRGQSRNDSTVRAVGVEIGAATYFWSALEFRGRWDLIDRVLDD
jgi:hypothetical protein